MGNQYQQSAPNTSPQGVSVNFHYVFEKEDQHHIDARTLVRCEMEYLVLSEEIAKLFGTEIKIYAKPKTEGSLWDIFVSVIPGFEEIIHNVVTTQIAKLVIAILKKGCSSLIETLERRFANPQVEVLSVIREIYESYNIELTKEEISILETYKERIFHKSALRKLLGKDEQAITQTIQKQNERLSCIHKRFNNSCQREESLTRIDITISTWSETIHSNYSN